MAKFGKFVGKKDEPISKQEIAEFMSRFSLLVAKYDDTLALNYHISDLGGLIINFNGKPKKFRNVLGSRITFNGIFFAIYKQSGYIDNFDWGKMKIIDSTKPQRDFESAPPFQYSVYLRVMGCEIPYRHRTKMGIAPKSSYQYGTEFDDIDFTESIRELFQRQLQAR